MRVRIGHRNSGPSGVVGKIFVTLFLSIFFLAGIGALFVLAQDSWGLLAAYSWTKTECVIESSNAVESPESTDSPYQFEVRYRYRVEGQEYVSEIYQRKYDGSTSVTDSQRLADSLAPGTQTYCYVNPEDATEAALRRDSLLGLFWLLFPFAFIIPGLGGIVLVWRSGGVSSRSKKASISEGRASLSPAKVKGCGVLFFGLFFVVGMGLFVPFFGWPAYQHWASGSWTELPCTIEKIGIEDHPSDDSTTYSIEVLYSYQLGGRTYKSDRYSFARGSDSNYTSKKRAVDELPVGTRTTCWVNPNDPLDSVLVRSTGHLWFGLFPLVFVAVGGIGIAAILLGKFEKGVFRGVSRRGFAGQRTSEQRTSELVGAGFQEISGGSFGENDGTSDLSTDSGELVLKASASPIAKFVGITLVALFWNGLISVFVWQVVKSYREGSPDGCLTLFLIPFVLVGLCLLVAVPHQFMALFNPKPTLILQPGKLSTGNTATLKWSFSGSVGRISLLKIRLVGLESARYSHGTNTTTVTENFFEQDLITRQRGLPLARGEVQLEIPAGTMHSFDGGHNEIRWKLELAGEISMWPDIAYEFPLQIEPGWEVE